MNILGLNYGGHDTSACITIKGKVIAACEQKDMTILNTLEIFLLIRLVLENC